MMSTTTTTTIDPSWISPWLMLPPAASEDGCGGAVYKLYSPASKKVLSFKKEASPAPMPSADGLVRLVGSSHGWVATFNLENQHIFLSDPISGRHMKLPDILTLPEFLFGGLGRIVEKIILTCSPTAAECRAVMTFGVRGMALCCPGGGKWTWFGDYFYKDFVYSSRQKTSLLRHRVVDTSYDGYPYRTFAFNVHEIDWKGRRPNHVFRYVEDGPLNGLAMFIGNNHSFALSAAEFPDLKPDSIYFTEENEFTEYYDNHLNYGGHDNGIFNYVDRNFSSLYYSCHASNFTRIIPPPIWFTPTPHRIS